jgi:hypothetical protein
MNKFFVLLMALGLAFAAGWLFANEVRPPLLEDVGLAMWMAVGGVAVLSAAMVAK